MKNNQHLSRQERIEEAFKKRKADFALILENLSEDQNISAIIRTAEAFGVGKVYIVYQDKKPHLSKNISSGASKWLEIEYFTEITACIAKLKQADFKIYGALVDPQANILWEANFSDKVAILVGNEAQGMSEVSQKLVDQNLYLPMIGLTESLNVSVSAALFLYEAFRQKEQ